MCKFFLKRLLGKFIRGELDLDGLEVQLGAGTVQLNGLALNTDYLNEQLGVTPVIIKEGFITSISIKIPWKALAAEKCEINVEDFELVLVPRTEFKTSSSSEECSTSEVYPSASPSQRDSEQVEGCGIHVNGGSTYLGVQDGVKMIAKMVERLLLGLHVKIKNLIVAFEQATETCNTNLGVESSCQSQSILVLRVLQTEYGTDVSGDACETAGLHPDDITGLVMLTKVINFNGVSVDLYDVIGKDAEPGCLRPIASVLSGRSAGSQPGKTPVPFINGNEGGFSGSVQLSIPWKSGSMDIPKVNAEIHFDPVKLQLQPCTIQRLIFLLHSIGECRDKGSEPSLHSSNRQSFGKSMGFEHDLHRSSHLEESVTSTTDVMFSAFEGSFLDLPSATRGETANNTLIPDSMIISNWVQNVDLGESIDEFFECMDGTRSLHAGPANSGLWSLTYSVFGAITAASTLASGSVLIPSRQQRVECNLNVRLDGVSIVLAFEDHIQCLKTDCHDVCTGECPLPRELDVLMVNSVSNLVSHLESSRAECLQRETGSLDEEEIYLEANIEDLSFSVQVSAQEVKFNTMVKQFEMFEYLLDKSGKGTEFSLSNCGECSEGSMFSIRHLQRAIEDALPQFPVSLYTLEEVDKVTNIRNIDEVLPCEAMAKKSSNEKESTSGTFKKFVKIKLLVSECDSAHHCSLNCHFGNMKCNDSSISCTKFEAQLQPFVLWLDFYVANKLCQLIEGIEYPSKKYSKDSDESRDGCSSTGGNDAPQACVQGNVSISWGRVILCFPVEINKDMSPYFLRDNFICVDLSESASAQKCQQEGLLREVKSLKDSHFPSSSIVNLKMGGGALFLVSPSKGTNDKSIHGHLDELHFSTRKVFSILKGKERDHSIIGIQWLNIPGKGPRNVERAWEEANEHWTRGAGSKRVSGNNSEFLGANTTGTLEFTDAYDRHEMIRSSAILIHFSLPHAQLDLYGSEHILVANLLSLLTDCIFFKGDKEICLNAEGKPVKESLPFASNGSHSKVSQSSFLFECKAVDIAVHLRESGNTRASMEKELPGSWASFRLTVGNLEVLSVSNLGGVSGASYLWLNHDEGLLYGSLSDKMEQPQSAGKVRELCLLCCKTNVLGRGDGGGTNALASGNAGTTIIHLDSPQHLQSLTSVTIRCGTLVAPGGRLDWLPSIISFFSQSVDDEQQIADTGLQEDLVKDGNSYTTSFLLELLDTAVSYEPFIDASRVSSSSTDSPIEETCAPVSCILAAAAMRLSIKTKPNTDNKKYTILLEDVGLLLLDLSKRRNNKHAYDAESLHSKGYVKIAGEAMMNLEVEMNSQDNLLWTVTCTQGNICLDTCHDTTAALIRLVVQLQQLFAPDYEASAVHLQSMRDIEKQVNSFELNDENFDETLQIYRNSVVFPANKEYSDIHHTSETTSVGLMDVIVENAFSSGDVARLKNEKAPDSTVNGESYFLLSELILEESRTFEGSVSASVYDVDPSLHERACCELASSTRPEDMHAPSQRETCFSFIEDYYFPDSFPMPQRFESKESKVGDSVRPSNTTVVVGKDVLDGKGGWYEDSSLRILENHISNSDRMQDKVVGSHSSSGSSTSGGNNIQPVGRISLKNIRVTWRMHAGSDWPAWRKCDSIPMQGDSARNTSSLLEVVLCGMNFQYDTFPEGGLYSSKLAVSIQDLRIFDRSEHAPWKMVLLDYHSRMHPRESSAKALKLELEAVKPDPSTPLEEYRLTVKLLPLQLHLDQSQLDFFIKFFSQKASSLALQGDLSGDRQCSSSVSDDAPYSKELSAAEEGLLPFFQKCEIYPVTIHVNYVPRRVDLVALKGGNYAELLNLVSWKGIDLHLKGVETGGISGWSGVSEIVVGKWLEDISQNQVHKLLKGAAPIRSLVALGCGAAKLFSLPAEHYKKDRRLLKGLQKGVIAFLRSISLEAVGCGVHLAAGAHGILIHTESALGGIPPSFSLTSRDNLEVAGKINQPGDARQGLRQACESLTRGLERTATSLIGNPIKSYVRGEGAGHALLTAVQAAPSAALAPASAAAGAVHRALLGVRNSLDHDHKKESEEKHYGKFPVLILTDDV